MTESASITVINPGKIEVRGLLSVDTVAELQKPGFAMLDRSAETAVFDFTDVVITGSAVIALLISWQRYALKAELKISFIAVPDNLLAIAEASGLRDILHFEWAAKRRLVRNLRNRAIITRLI